MRNGIFFLEYNFSIFHILSRLRGAHLTIESTRNNS